MIRAQKPFLLLAGVSLVAVTACTEPTGMGDPNDPNRNTRQGAVVGGMLGAATGAIVSDNRARGAVIGGILGAGTGALVGNNLDKQEAELRRDLGNQARITNTGDRLIVSMPQDILFAVDSATLRPDLQGDLRTIAGSLNSYPDTTIQVIGHTDNTGAAAYNQALSERRANAVAGVLINSGVSAGRIRTFGAGEDQPIASNQTPQGRAQNRRVEIVIVPNR
jgi:outer membrane protein OmpA-like peptidoglycan-associated protein